MDFSISEKEKKYPFTDRAKHKNSSLIFNPYSPALPQKCCFHDDKGNIAVACHQAIHAISYTLLESAMRPDIQPKSSRSHKVEPSVIWMIEGR